MKFRKRPVIIEAKPYTGDNTSEIKDFVGISLIRYGGRPVGPITIRTLAGDMKANINDWIIKGVNGEYYPCKPDIFDKTYEPMEESR